MTENERPSVVIPAHLRAHLLSEALASVVGQTLTPAEVLVVDDAADPETRAVVEQAAAVAPYPVRYVENPQGGVCHSRNLGGRTAGQAIVAFLDDDDIWEPGFLETVTNALLGDGSDFAMSGIYRYEGTTRTARVTVARLTSDTVFTDVASMTGSNLIIRRDVLMAVGGFDPTMTVFNDRDLLVRLIDRGYRYSVVPAPLSHWREHPGPRIATFTLRRADGLERFLSRYGGRMLGSERRALRMTAMGIRRRLAGSRRDRIRLTGLLAINHGMQRMGNGLAVATRYFRMLTAGRGPTEREVG